MSPYEADAQLAYLCREGIAHAALSEDSDLMPYGCDKVNAQVPTHAHSLVGLFCNTIALFHSVTPQVIYKYERGGMGQEYCLHKLPECDSVSLALWTHEMVIPLPSAAPPSPLCPLTSCALLLPVLPTVCALVRADGL